MLTHANEGQQAPLKLPPLPFRALSGQMWGRLGQVMPKAALNGVGISLHRVQPAFCAAATAGQALREGTSVLGISLVSCLVLLSAAGDGCL